MRILVTGGAGFVGSHLCDALLGRGHEVIAVDNLLTGRAGNLRDGTLLRHDITNPLEISGPIDRVYHLASPASPADYAAHPIETLEAGSAGTRNALQVARVKGARYLLASTSEVYGDPEVHPQREDYWGRVNPIGPRSCYDEAKRYAEALTVAVQRTLGVETRIARIFNTYGPRMRPNDGRAVCTFIAQALRGQPLTVYGDGSQTRSFCYVSDLVDGLIRLMESDERMPVNLGNPEEITVLQLAKEILDLTGARNPIEFRPLPPDDPRQRRPDISKAHRLLGWKPQVTRREGLALTISWFRGVTISTA